MRRDVEFLCEWSTRYLRSERSQRVRYRDGHSKRNQYLQATMYYFVYFISISLTRRSWLNSRFKKSTSCQSFMALNKVSDVSAADWLSQAHVQKISYVMIRYFSVVEIPLKHSSLNNKIKYPVWYLLKATLLQLIWQVQSWKKIFEAHEN